MTRCAACGQPVSAGTEPCPNCWSRLRKSSSEAHPERNRRWSILKVAALLLVVVGIFAVLLNRAVHQAREAARRTKCKSHLKQLSLALHNYHDAYGCFPPAYTVDESGKPLHSWRALILPYVDQNDRYQAIRFDEPWDSPHNIQLLSPIPYVFRCPSDLTAGEIATNYVAVFGPHSVFRGATPVSVHEVKDGSSSTLMIGETKGEAQPIPWMKPEDVDITQHPSIGDPAGFCSHHVGGTTFSLCDGSVRFVSAEIPLPILQALYTIDGGEVIGDF